MRFNIVKNRKWYFGFSLLVSIIGIVLMLTMGLNLSTDFKSGTRVQFNVGQAFNPDQVAQQLEANVKDINVTQTQQIQGQYGVIIRIDKKITPAQENEINQYLSAHYKNPEPQISSVDPEVARELARNAIQAVLYASIGIILYMAIRFEYRFAISGIISVFQVVLIVISLFALMRLEIDVNFIAAILTIVGYCIHDTIVIFDRIRENLKHTKVKTTEDLEHLVNESVWQTMARSINTILTVVFATGAIYLLGGTAIRNFALALLIGLVVGGYSSIFIASQIWVSWKSRELKKPKKGKVKVKEA